MELHKILIGIVLIGVIITGIATFMSEGMTTYSQNASAWEDINEDFNKIEDINDQVNQYESSQPDTEGSDGILDVLGSFFTKTYQAARVLKTSVTSSYSMADSAIDNLPADSGVNYLKLALNTIILIVISVGIFLHFVTKSERT